MSPWVTWDSFSITLMMRWAVGFFVFLFRSDNISCPLASLRHHSRRIPELHRLSSRSRKTAERTVA